MTPLKRLVFTMHAFHVAAAAHTDGDFGVTYAFLHMYSVGLYDNNLWYYYARETLKCTTKKLMKQCFQMRGHVCSYIIVFGSKVTLSAAGFVINIPLYALILPPFRSLCLSLSTLCLPLYLSSMQISLG